MSIMNYQSPNQNNINYSTGLQRQGSYPAHRQPVSESEKRSLYHRKGQFNRVPKLKIYLLQIFHELANYPRLYLEVFFRSNFGERYFGPHSVIGGFLVFLLIPFVIESGIGNTPSMEVIGRHFVWYAFLSAFAFFAVKRLIETKRRPGVFDFARYSKSNGDLHPRLQRFWAAVWMELFGKLPSPRTMEIYLEAVPFLLLGFIGWLVDPMFGNFMIFCSVVYSVSFMAEYWLGDQFIMDMIDEWIVAEQTKKHMFADVSPDQMKGVNFRFDKPSDPAFRQTLAAATLGAGEPAASVL